MLREMSKNWKAAPKVFCYSFSVVQCSVVVQLFSCSVVVQFSSIFKL